MVLRVVIVKIIEGDNLIPVMELQIVYRFLMTNAKLLEINKMMSVDKIYFLSHIGIRSGKIYPCRYSARVNFT